jgi:hypothetical protein
MFPIRAIVGETAELLVIVLAIVLIFVLLKNACRGGTHAVDRHAGEGDPESADEAQLMRQLLGQVEKMDQRISNLETILRDKEERK